MSERHHVWGVGARLLSARRGKSAAHRSKLHSPVAAVLLFVGAAAVTVAASPIVALVALVGLSTALLAVATPRLVVLVLLPASLLVPSGYELNLGLGVATTPTRLVILLTAAVFVLTRQPQDHLARRQPVPGVFVVAVAAYVVVVFLRLATQRGPAVVSDFTFLTFEPFLPAFLAAAAARTRRDLVTLATSLVVVVTVASALACVESLVGHQLFAGRFFFNPPMRAGRLRARSVFPHPIVLGVAIMLVMPLAVACVSTTASATRRFLFVGAIAVMASALLLSFSRGPWIAVVLTLLVMAVMMKGHRRAWLGVAVVLIGQALMTLPLGDDVVPLLRSGLPFGTRDAKDLSVENRLVLWDEILDYASDHPFGIGPGRAREVQIIAYVDGYPRKVTESVDSAYLLLLLEVGFPGLALFVIVLLVLCAATVRTARQHRLDPHLGPFAAALVAGQIGMLFVSFTVATLTTWYQLAVPFWLLAGLALALRRHTTADPAGPRPLPHASPPRGHGPGRTSFRQPVLEQELEMKVPEI